MSIHWDSFRLAQINRKKMEMETINKAQTLLQKSTFNASLSVTLCLLVFFELSIPTTTAEEGSYNWETAKQLYPGIRYIHTEPSSPRKMVINCVQIDSQTPRLRFYTTPCHVDWMEGKIETNRQTTRNFIRQSHQKSPKLMFAINANAFSPWPAPFQREDPTDVSGLAISTGTLVSRGDGTPSFLVDKTGKLQITTVNADTDLSDIETAVSGFSLCLVEGQAPTSGNDLHPRTGLGLSQDGRYLFLLTIDGRQPSSLGATVQDVGNLLKQFGAHTGINMDGGGSTTMAWWNHSVSGEDKCQLLNNPVGDGESHEARKATDPFVPMERATGNNLGVYFLETNTK